MNGSAPAMRVSRRERQRVKAMIERSSIMVLASHSDELIRQMCNRAILLDHGRLLADGPTEDVLEMYARMNKESCQEEFSPAQQVRRLRIKYPSAILHCHAAEQRG